MNCTNCNAPLEMNARFCRQCGTSVSQPMSNNAAPTFVSEPPTNQSTYQQTPSFQSAPQQPWSQPPTSPSMPPQQPMYLQSERQDPNIGTETPKRPRKRRRGCLPGALITLVVLLILIGGGWFLVVRPYLDNLAQAKLDNALTDAVNHIPAQVAAVPAGTQVPITETLLNNLLVLQSSPDDLVKNMQIHITSSQMRMEFSVFGFASAVTAVPQVNQGKLVVTNVQIEGIASLILTSDEITALANRHLADAQQRINHSITSVQLKDHELDLVFGPQSGGPTLPTLP
ncbi:MAG: zinc ribbon domain-containing protein [Ktedonobacteraceae bacterium]